MRAIVLFFFLSGMLSACAGDNSVEKSGGVSQEKPKIVTSIKPIQAIVLAIAGDSADVEQLIPDYASPHDYSFKPSDIRKVNAADIVFRIDEHMETQLNGVLDNARKDGLSIVSLADAAGLKLLAANASHQPHGKKAHDDDHSHSHDDEHQGEHAADHHDDHSNIDFHVWTSPKNAVLMANHIAKVLSKVDAENVKLYQQNIEGFFQKVKNESDKVTAQLQPYKHKPYIVFHNSWQYFADEFGLQAPIVVDMHEGIASGAKTMSELQDRIIKENIRCVFYDNGISTARLKVISKNAKAVEIDVLGKSIALDQASYVNWLGQLGNQIASCLSE